MKVIVYIEDHKDLEDLSPHFDTLVQSIKKVRNI